MKQFFVAGRICDQENFFKIVNADNASAAEDKFSEHLRELESQPEAEIYVELCETLEKMQYAAI